MERKPAPLFEKNDSGAKRAQDAERGAGRPKSLRGQPMMIKNTAATVLSREDDEQQ
jgi:hypothetical protein